MRTLCFMMTFEDFREHANELEALTMLFPCWVSVVTNEGFGCKEVSVKCREEDGGLIEGLISALV